MAGGGIKVNNITVSGGADGLTPVFKIEGGILFYSYNNREEGSWYELGQVKGVDGTNGKDGKTGAKLISQELIGQDANGGNIYKQTFDDGTIAYFTAPKGADGKDGTNVETDKTLTQEDVPADAKAVGDRLKEVGSTDVQINGTSITENGVANIPLANGATQGVVYTPNGNWNGILISNGIPTLIEASTEQIDEKKTRLFPITPQNLDHAIKAGLISNSEITPEDYASICDTIGAVPNSIPTIRNYGDANLLTFDSNGVLKYSVVLRGDSSTTDRNLFQYTIPMRNVKGVVIGLEPEEGEVNGLTPKSYVDRVIENAVKKYRHCITADISKDGNGTAGGGGFCVEIIDDVDQATTNSVVLLIAHKGKFKASGGVKVNDTIMPIISIYCNGDNAGNYIEYIGADGYINQYSITDPDWIMNVADNIYDF